MPGPVVVDIAFDKSQNAQQAGLPSHHALHRIPPCVQVDNPLRGFLYNLMTMQFTDYFLVAVVLLSCAEVGWPAGCGRIGRHMVGKGNAALQPCSHG